jgi:hypothetical protein
MKKYKVGRLIGIVLSVAAGAAAAQGWRPPAESERCPSKWGAGDEFALTMQPLKLRGGTGSTVVPAAIR